MVSCCILCGRDGTAQSTTERLTLYRRPVRLFIQRKERKQVTEQVAYYMKNAETIKQGLQEAGFTVYGGVNSPYIWLKTPEKMTSWEFFDYLLEQANVVGTPGSGFGPSGEGYFRLTGFGSYENTKAAIERVKRLSL